MWFGSLVAVKWWNDVGLNEAIATWVAFHAMSKIPSLAEFHDTCWITFLEYKFWGVAKDSLNSTHSICCAGVSADRADSLFDGISYGKGPAFIKQLFAMLGENTMRQGIKTYFQNFKWSYATVKNFIDCMNHAYIQSGDKSLGQDFTLTEWCSTWFSSSGINTLTPIVETNEYG